MDSRTEQILDFLKTTDGAKNILRKGYLGDGSRRESIAEHMWHLAIWAMLLHREIGFENDLLKTLKLVLTHDLVEIYAGDTYAYDDKGIDGQREREERGAKKLFGMLPDDLGKEFRALWDEFEETKTPESRFAKALDNIQGFAQNCISGGKSWKENGIGKERTFSRTAFPRETDPVFAEILDRLYETADKEGAWGTRGPENP
ncbi:MAG: HD domain-containing protein [Thermovirgaceae bacterium]|nr:HD domain-containing protein [Thermovirgaceae bacterium]